MFNFFDCSVDLKSNYYHVNIESGERSLFMMMCVDFIGSSTKRNGFADTLQMDTLGSAFVHSIDIDHCRCKNAMIYLKLKQSFILYS